ncbi:hypothetical protein [Schleiferilactobacillus perolens]|jgi:hypothetical protein|uniref:hypothetical protein n=1 Tax=Schleiferilactobacillus perolens TaxID=100468 RepID=UPI002353B286|nr:hypothetical protein [Schleiferilactobacillus perolens]MCI1913200.1 hypothetical protein [Schleiferilactobacillus harbinensis]MCI2171513.1 hypothetical protein [Schleiferilactobacillus perolens]
MKKNRWGFLNICVAAVIAAGGAIAVANSARADTDTGSGTATVTFTGGSQIVQVPNFDFGADNKPSGVALFNLISSASDSAGGTTDVSQSKDYRALTVRVPNQADSGDEKTYGWNVSVRYQSDGSDNGVPKNSSIVFNLPSSDQYADGVQILLGNDDGVFTDAKWNGDKNWIFNTLPGTSQAYMKGGATDQPAADAVQYEGFVPIGWTPGNSTDGRSYSGVTVFGRKTDQVDTVITGSASTGYSNPYYRLNFPHSNSAQIYVPVSSQISNLNKVLTGNLVWTLSKGTPQFGWPTTSSPTDSSGTNG